LIAECLGFFGKGYMTHLENHLKLSVLHIIYSPKAVFNSLKVSVAFLPILKNYFHTGCSFKSVIFKYKWNNALLLHTAVCSIDVL
jgi:hypothetical protein